MHPLKFLNWPTLSLLLTFNVENLGRNSATSNKVIHLKYYKHLKKKLLSTAIWADNNGLVFGRIACISSKNLRSETI